MVSIPSSEMSKFRSRLRAILLHALLFVAIAQLAATSDASWKVPLGDLLRALAPEVDAARSDDEAPDPEPQLYIVEVCAEIDEVDARRRLNVRPALPSPARANVVWEESVRVRTEDRRSCRPPNRAS